MRASEDLGKVVRQLESQVQKSKIEMNVKYVNKLAQFSDKFKQMNLELQLLRKLTNNDVQS